MARVLLHICCAPCAIHPVSALRAEGFYVHGFFFNPNIQPYQELRKRLDTLESFAGNEDLPLIVRPDYDPRKFFRQVAFREAERCIHCYSERLGTTARLAKKSGFDAFTTTLLYSKRQKHDLVAALAREAAKKHGVAFLYRDFRDGWKKGQEAARALNIYRQQYCGCIYSEKERYFKNPGLKETAR